MEKIDKSGWTTICVLTIVSVLFFRPAVVTAQEPQKAPAAATREDGSDELKALKARCLELEGALLRSQTELKSVRADMADAALELRKLRSQVADLRVKAANVLANQDDLEDAGTLRAQLRDMRRIHTAQKELQQEALGFHRYMNSVLDVLDQNDRSGLRKKLNGRYLLLKRKLDDAERLSRPQVAVGQARRGRVLAVNTELGIVVLDRGRDAGARPGSVWEITAGRKTLKARVVEARSSLSAAVLLAGDLDDINAGAAAKRVTAKATTDK